MERLLRVCLVLLLVTCPTMMGTDIAPTLMNYQGLLLDSNGDPVTNCVTLTFTIYDAAIDGSIIWQETHSNVCPNEGQINVLLGDGDTPQPVTDAVFTTSERWLGVQVGSDEELTPRTRLAAVGYSQRVNTVDLARGGVVSGDLALEAIDGDGSDLVMMTTTGNQGAVLVTATDVAKLVMRSVQIAPAQGVALRTIEQNGDETISLLSAPEGGSLEVNASDASKSLTRTIGIYPAQGTVLSSKEQNGDETVSLSTSPSGGAVVVNASDASKGVTRTVGIYPAQGTVLSSKEQNGDETVLITSDAGGAAVLVGATDVAKGVTSAVEIKPADSIALLARNSSGDSLIALSTSGSSGKLTLTSNTVKGLKRIEIKEDGIYFFNETKSDTTMIISADGNIVGKGKVAMGQNMSNSGYFSNCLGWGNTADADSASVAGGSQNAASGRLSIVAGGRRNKAMEAKSAVLGGSDNEVHGGNTSIAGGVRNISSYTATHSFMGGGLDNVAGDFYAFLGTGYNNTAGDSLNPYGNGYCVVISGANNGSLARQTFIGNGDNNLASAQWATVLNGQFDTASGEAAFCGGGRYNVVSGHGAVITGGGYTNNHPNGNLASGELSVIPGGTNNEASGLLSFASGRRAKATHDGAFLWADTSDYDFSSTAANEFSARATGGVRFVSGLDGSGNPNAGVSLAAGASAWSTLSDRNAKEHFQAIDGAELLGKLSKLDISTWNYKSQDESIRHAGPIAQEFYAAFGVGEDDKHISTVDADGIALAAIQALYLKSIQLEQKSDRIEELETQIAELRALVNKLIDEREKGRP
jgi:hypothetical protein